jgi:hypothetical protein
MSQKSLVDYTSSDFASPDSVNQAVEHVETLSVPTVESRYCLPSEWAAFSEMWGAATLKGVYEEVDDFKLKRGIAACISKQTDEREWKTKSFNFEKQSVDVSESFVDTIKDHTFGMFDRLPVGTAAVLSMWVPQIELYNRDNYDKYSGYYDPETFHVELAFETGWGGWYNGKCNRSHSYVNPVTVHEFGHALQYLAGITIEEESIDNRDKSTDKWRLDFIQQGPVAPWQMKLREAGVSVFKKLQSGEYEPIDGISKYQTKNLEEVYACSFTAYITNESYLESEQPILYSVYESLC